MMHALCTHNVCTTLSQLCRWRLHARRSMVHGMKTLRTLATAFAIAIGLARAAYASGDARPSTYFEGEGYRGHIGKSAVVMRLAVHDGRVSGHYFYEKYGRDLAVWGTLQEGQFDLRVGFEQMFLHAAGDGALEGRWSEGARSLPMRVGLIPRNGEVVVFHKKEMDDVVSGIRLRHPEVDTHARKEHSLYLPTQV